MYLGTGADGELVVDPLWDLSVDASGDRTVADGIGYPVVGIDGAEVLVAADADGLGAGDEVLLIALQGSAAANAAVGTYEFASVASVAADLVTLAQPVAGIYGELDNVDLTDQTVALFRVPHYTDVTVLTGGTLTAGAWDGQLGGVVAFRANGMVWVEAGGQIVASELGFAGGDTGTCNDCDAFQGESYAGLGDGDNPGNTSPPYNQYIGAEVANFGGGGVNVTGGGGEYGGGATPGDSWTGGSWAPPEAGEVYGLTDLSLLFLGSGGGGVWNGGNDDPAEDPGPGGDGGGILIIGAGALVADDAGAFVCTGGTTYHWSRGTWTYGAGGGAGGSVYLITGEAVLPAGAVDATGGFGEDTHIRIGGDGGVGRVRLDCVICGGFDHGTPDADIFLLDAAEPDPGWSEIPQ